MSGQLTPIALVTALIDRVDDPEMTGQGSELSGFAT
jgi:hypothetical protein